MTHWQSDWYPAPEQLSGVLAGIWSVRAAHDATLSARVLPDASSCLVFRRDGTVLRSAEDAGRPWGTVSVSGPRSGPFDFTLDAAGQIFIVQLRPAGAMTVLGVPMSSLADEYEPLDSVVGAMSPRVADTVLSGAGDRSCARAIEGWLFRRCQSSVAGSDLTAELVRQVHGSGGNIRVDELAAHADVSRRHLVRIMREQLGTSPKLFGRILRFDRAVQLGRFRPELPWSQIALDAGYADQAHLTREFVKLGGIRPSDLRGVNAATLW